jgi:hypothetical protein
MKTTTKHLTTRWMPALAATAALAAVPTVNAGAASGSGSGTSSTAALKNFHGTVASVSTAARTLRITRPNGTTLTFRITASTTFERLGGGLSALRQGRSIEVKARRSDGRWVARKVEPATAEHATGDDRRAGDDHGSGGHGSDD